ncbi:hypothetical protein HDV01_006691 [Terramyces sp. JEL0728]|nr:hypothetical protein HDV01_006691 [Terramyces sp. JEL0728]
MSRNYDGLEAVQQEIKELIKKETKLLRKEQKGTLSDDDEIELKELISKSFGEADAEWIANVTGINTKYREWTSYITELDNTVVPSAGFKEAFENVSKAFHMHNEAGRRIFLNLFLSDIVLFPEFNNILRIFPEIEMSVETKGQKKRKLNGKTDYTIGFGKDFDIFDNTPPRELHLIAFEARTEFGEKDLWQCVAETATLYKSRKDANKKKCSVWGVLSNATTWKFIYIDEDGKLWRSNDFLLNIRSYREDQILPIYQFLYYIVKCCFEACTPTPTPNPSIEKLNEQY